MVLVVMAVSWALLCVAAGWSFPLNVLRASSSCGEELVRQLDEAHDDRQRVVAANDVLSELEHRMESGQRVPLTFAWIGFLSALAWAAAGVIIGEPERVLLQCAVPAAAAALLCLGARRLGKRLVMRERTRIDGVVERLVGDLYDAEIVLPRRRRRRDRGRRRRRR